MWSMHLFHFRESRDLSGIYCSESRPSPRAIWRTQQFRCPFSSLRSACLTACLQQTSFRRTCACRVLPHDRGPPSSFRCRSWPTGILIAPSSLRLSRGKSECLRQTTFFVSCEQRSADDCHRFSRVENKFQTERRRMVSSPSGTRPCQTIVIRASQEMSVREVTGKCLHDGL